MNAFHVCHPSRWLAGLGALGLGSALAVQSLFGPPAAAVAAAKVDPAAVASAQDLSSAFRSASESVMPAVVTIRSEAAVAQMDADQGQGNVPNGIPEEMQPFLKRFFGDNLPEMR